MVKRKSTNNDLQNITHKTKYQLMISHERGKDWEVFTTSGTYPWSFVTQLFHIGQPSHGGDRKTVEVMTST
jgi:hypothetical protein